MRVLSGVGQAALVASRRLDVDGVAEVGGAGRHSRDAAAAGRAYRAAQRCRRVACLHSRYNFKCYIVLEANARCIVECDGDEQVFRTGEIFEFDNTRPHSMTNDGATQRTTMIVCLKVER